MKLRRAERIAEYARRWAEHWGPAEPVVQPPWTEADVAREAAEMWEGNWVPACQGGNLLFITPRETVQTIGEAFEGVHAYGEAVWGRLVDIYCAMYLGNRRARRITRKTEGR